MLAQAVTAPTTSATAPAHCRMDNAIRHGCISAFSLPMIVLMAVVFYFLMIRPQQQRAKDLAKLVSSIKSGDKVETASGIRRPGHFREGQYGLAQIR